MFDRVINALLRTKYITENKYLSKSFSKVTSKNVFYQYHTRQNIKICIKKNFNLTLCLTGLDANLKAFFQLF